MARSVADYDRLLTRADEAYARGLSYAQRILSSSQIFRDPGPGATKSRIEAAVGGKTWDEFLAALGEDISLIVAYPSQTRTPCMLGGKDLKDFLVETGRLLGEAEFMMPKESKETSKADDHSDPVRGIESDPSDEIDQEEVFNHSIFSGSHHVGATTQDPMALRQEAAELLIQLKEVLRTLQMLSQNDAKWIDSRVKEVSEGFGSREHRAIVNNTLLRSLHRQVRSSLHACTPTSTIIEHITAQLGNLYFEGKADIDSLTRRVRRAVRDAP